MNILERIIEIIETDYNYWNVDVDVDTTFDELGLDSLDCIELLLDVESEFNMKIDDESFEDFLCINNYVKYIENNA